MAQPQSYKNHTKWDPPFHFFLAPLAVGTLIFNLVQLVRRPSHEAFHWFLLTLWATVALFLIRLYAMKVQDRVIRLEERLRMKELLPAGMQPRIKDFTEDQFIGLRFASDAELPELAEKALAGNWNRKQIKEAVKNWRADHWRV